MPKPPSLGPAEVARTLYGSTFGVPKSKVTDAMTDWADLSSADQLYTIANLLYLNLQEVARLNRRVGMVLTRVEEMMFEPTPPEPPPQQEPKPAAPRRPDLRVAPPPPEMQLTEEEGEDAEDEELEEFGPEDFVTEEEEE